MSLLTPSGGLVYHFRALRYGALWRPFRASLQEFLEESVSRGRELVLVGPSAGHCLPLAWLRSFERVAVLEPDPVARQLLSVRARGPRYEFLIRDYLLEPLLDDRPGLDAVLAERPHAAVVFCNVLGQLHFGLSDEQQARFQERFRTRIWPALADRPWASFHDRWSFDHAGHAVPFPVALHFDATPSDRELADRYFGRDGPPVTVLDHGTSDLFPPSLPRRFLSWRLTPSAFHLVEAVAG